MQNKNIDQLRQIPWQFHISYNLEDGVWHFQGAQINCLSIPISLASETIITIN